jgi:hypothetical protein
MNNDKEHEHQYDNEDREALIHQAMAEQYMQDEQDLMLEEAWYEQECKKRKEMIDNNVLGDALIHDPNAFFRPNGIWPVHPQLKNLLSVPFMDSLDPTNFAIRLEHISASEVGSIIEQERFPKYYQQLFDEKCGIAGTDPTLPAFQHGHKYEEESMVLYSNKISRAIFKAGYLISSKDTLIACTPDAVTEDFWGVENKAPYSRCVYINYGLIDLMTDQICYYHQTQSQAFVCGFDRVDFVQYGVAPNKWYTEKPFHHFITVPTDYTWYTKHATSIHNFWLKVSEYRNKHPDWIEDWNRTHPSSVALNRRNMWLIRALPLKFVY